MDQIRVDVRDASAAGAFGARAHAQLPAHVKSHVPYVAGEPVRAKRSWLGFAVRMVRDAAIAVAFMAMVPIGIVAFNGEGVWRSPMRFTNSTSDRLARAEASRSLSLPVVPSITPMQAGLAFNALHEQILSPAFPPVETSSGPDAARQSAKLTPDMFPTVSPDVFHSSGSGKILETATAGLSPQEMTVLRTLATAPAWKNFDLVARASAVDFIGSRFKLPFAPGAFAGDLPMIRFKSTTGMAHAAVSRAAFHIAIGQRDSAATVLRSIVSFGFALIDNGTSVIDELIGNVIVGIGRDGLRRFYVLTQDPRAGAAAVAPPPRLAKSEMRGGTPAASAPLNEMRQRLIDRSADPSVRRGERYEALRLLSASSCTNVQELLFGPGSDVTDAFRNARRDLARYPSERALVDLIHLKPEARRADLGFDPLQMLAVSSATVAGAVLRNPRLAACTRIAGGFYGG